LRWSSNKSFRPGQRFNAVEASVVDVVEAASETLRNLKVRSVKDGVVETAVSGNRVELGTDVRTGKVVRNSSPFKARSRQRRWLAPSQGLAEKFSARRSDFGNVDEVDLAVDVVQKSRHVGLEGAGRGRGRRGQITPVILSVSAADVLWPLVEADVGVVVTDVERVGVAEGLGIAVTDGSGRSDLSRKVTKLFRLVRVLVLVLVLAEEPWILGSSRNEVGLPSFDGLRENVDFGFVEKIGHDVEVSLALAVGRRDGGESVVGRLDVGQRRNVVALVAREV